MNSIKNLKFRIIDHIEWSEYDLRQSQIGRFNLG